MKEYIRTIVSLILGITLLILGILDLFGGFSWTQLPIFIGTMKKVVYTPWVQIAASVTYVFWGAIITSLSGYLLYTLIKKR